MKKNKKRKIKKKIQVLEKILFIPDTHRPYHDKKAVELVMQVGRSLKPDHLIIGGDYGDFFSVSSHDKDPNRALKLEEEVNDIKQGLDELKSLGAKNNVFIAGNHEDRLERFLMTKAPELFNFISVNKILELDKKGYSYVPYKHSYKLGKLNITHDNGNAGRYSHYQALSTYNHNIIINHTHRFGYAVEGNAQGESHVCAMFGWLGDFESVDYMNRIKAKTTWTHGFGIGYLDKSTGVVYVVPVPIIHKDRNYSCLVEGVLYKV